MPEVTSTGQPEADTEQSTVEQFSRMLDEWRARIDTLLVQVDLASLDVRDELRQRFAVIENAYLAARSQLVAIRDDVTANAGPARERIRELLHDLRHVFEATEGVVRRGRAN